MLSVLIGVGTFAALVAVLIAGAVAKHRAQLKLLHSQFRKAYPNKVALLAYTDNHKWSAYMRDTLLPRLGTAVLVVNRSDAQWKAKNPLAARIVRHWGGRVAHNPLAIVFPSSGKPLVFRFYHAFRQNVKGKPQDLEAVVALLETSIHQELRRVA